MNQRALAEPATQYVTLGVDQEIFAVDVRRVHEILDLRPISRVPNAPAHMAGMIDVRGRSIPVIDLRIRLGLSPIQATPRTRIAVLDVDVSNRRLVVGLLVDRVYEVTGLSDHALEPPPDIGMRWQSQYIKSIGRRGAAFVIVIDLARLFSSDDVPMIDTGP